MNIEKARDIPQCFILSESYFDKKTLDTSLDCSICKVVSSFQKKKKKKIQTNKFLTKLLKIYNVS